MKFEQSFSMTNSLSSSQHSSSIQYFRYQYRRIQEKDITDERLPIMCIALWKKMKYAMKRDKKLKF